MAALELLQKQIRSSQMFSKKTLIICLHETKTKVII